jgi:hypothetical protein
MQKKPCVIEIAYSSRPAKTSKGRQNLTTKRFPRPFRFKQWLAGLAKKGNTGEKNGPFIISGPTLDPNNHSHAKSNIGKLTIIGYESDTKEDDPGPTLEKVIRTLDKVGLDSIGYTTFSHGLPGRGNRWRVFVFLSRPIKEPEQVALHDYLRDLLHTNGCEVKDSKDTRAYARVWYLPNAPLDMPVPTVVHGKASGAIDVDAAVAYHEENYGATEPRHRKQRINWRNKIHVNGYDSAIDWVNDSMDLRDVLAEHGYEYVSGSYDPREKAYTERWSCPRAQSTAGVIVFVDDDYLRVMSHHAENDPLWNPSLAVHDTFGVIQTLDFDGDMDEALSWARDQKFGASLDEDDGKPAAGLAEIKAKNDSIEKRVYELADQLPDIMRDLFYDIMSKARYPVPTFAFFATISVFCAMVNRRGMLDDQFPNIYFIFLADFGTGKDAVIKLANLYGQRSISKAAVVNSRVASAEGLEECILENGAVISVRDEYKNDTDREHEISLFENEIFQRIDELTARVRVGSTDDPKRVKYPFYMRISATTPSTLFTGKNEFKTVTSGHASRTLFITNGGKAKKLNRKFKPFRVLEQIRAWAEELWYDHVDVETLTPEEKEALGDDNVDDIFRDYKPWPMKYAKGARDLHYDLTDESDSVFNSTDDRITKICVTRQGEHAAAFSMVLSLAAAPLFGTIIDKKWVRLSWDIIRLYSEITEDFLRGNIHENVSAKNASRFIEVAKDLILLAKSDKLPKRLLRHKKHLDNGKIPQNAIQMRIGPAMTADELSKTRDNLIATGQIKVVKEGGKGTEKGGKPAYIITLLDQ